MKKGLALCLAGLMLTAALTACKDDTPTTPSGSDADDDGYVYNNNNNNNNNTDNGTNGTGDSSTNGSGTTNGGTNTATGTWVDAAGTFYAGDELRLRTSASSSGTNNIAKTVPLGTQLTRISTNGTWSKVTVSGDSTEYYVSNDWLASNGNDFSFTACEPVSLTINESSYNIMFFETPFEAGDEVYYENVVCKSGFKLSNVSQGYTLKKIGTSASGNWIKVEFVGTITISSTNVKTYTAEAPGVLYVKMRAIKVHGSITDPTYTGGSFGGTVGGRG